MRRMQFMHSFQSSDRVVKLFTIHPSSERRDVTFLCGEIHRLTTVVSIIPDPETLPFPHALTTNFSMFHQIFIKINSKSVKAIFKN